MNYVYGTWQVLTGLKAVGEDMTQPYVQRAAAWLKSVQKPDGSFGESCASYDDPSLKGQGESTASQTAWGAMGLMAALGADDPAVERAIQWLVDHQAADGNWDEHVVHGHGVPEGLLPQVPPVPAVLPGDGPGAVLSRHERLRL